MANVLIETLSCPLVPALVNAGEALAYKDIDITPKEPSGDGVFDIGMNGSTAPEQICILGYARGDPGSAFLMAIWGWRYIQVEQMPRLWLPMLLAELFCVTSDRNGFPGMIISDGDRFADSITTTAGVAYVAAPRNGTLAYARVGLEGVQKIQFDFLQSNVPSAFPNALWARA